MKQSQCFEVFYLSNEVKTLHFVAFAFQVEVTFCDLQRLVALFLWHFSVAHTYLVCERCFSVVQSQHIFYKNKEIKIFTEMDTV